MTRPPPRPTPDRFAAWLPHLRPRQERWVAEHKDRVHAEMLAVGAAFDYYAGKLNRPPPWMQRVGLEWLFRLLQEPRRLFGRYARYNSLFDLTRPRRPSAARLQVILGHPEMSPVCCLQVRSRPG